MDRMALNGASSTAFSTAGAKAKGFKALAGRPWTSGPADQQAASRKQQVANDKKQAAIRKRRPAATSQGRTVAPALGVALLVVAVGLLVVVGLVVSLLVVPLMPALGAWREGRVRPEGGAHGAGRRESARERENVSGERKGLQ